MPMIYECSKCHQLFKRTDPNQSRCPNCPWVGNWPTTSATSRGYGYEWRKLREQVFLLRGRQCSQCGSTKRLEVDHIIPKSRGGADRLDNLHVLCHVCHKRKTEAQGGPGRRR